MITWDNPSAITYGTALSGTQLNAKADVTGSFVYTPAAGTVLNAGDDQNLKADFTPADTANYNDASKTVEIDVNKAPLTVKADDKTKVLGAANPTLTASYTGFVNGDTQEAVLSSQQPTLNTTATASSPVGSYPISVEQGTLSASNYSFTYVAGTLSIQYAPASTSCLGAPGRTVLQPINADGTSTFKLGSTVPVKFRVCDVNGNSIGGTGMKVVTSFTILSKVSKTASVNEEVLSTTPDTEFRWDATNQQWIFNLSTKNLSASTKYTYRIALNDGTNIDFSFATR